jgi:hypothetical protein
VALLTPTKLSFLTGQIWENKNKNKKIKIKKLRI